jgi:ribonuclease J
MPSRERSGKVGAKAPVAGASSKKSTGAKRPKAKSKGKDTRPSQGGRPSSRSAVDPSPATPKGAVKVTFLGGLNEIGRNCATIEVDGKILLIDCGLMFPDLDMLGIDLVLPDFEYLRQNADNIVGCICTHGHEDHTGGLSFLLRELSFPIYGSALTLGLARNRIDEAGLTGRTEFNVVDDGERRQIGPFDCEFIPVTHSVPHGFATAIRTPQGVIMHSGDWKLDLTPVDGRLTDLTRMGSIADQEGVRLLLADSTNACEKGHSRSESSVGKVLYDLFHEFEGQRIITTCFASHVHRVQQIADAAIAFDRTIATMGLSMKKNVKLARELGLLDIPESRLRDIADVKDIDPAKLLVISTGSQGEPMSALSLMAANENKFLTLTEGDVVIMSSHPIPGNEANVTKVIDGLTRIGVEVIHSGIEDVHATGHAKKEECKTLLSITEPEWFVPVHGEYHHMAAHARLGRQMGVPADQVLVCEDGDQLLIEDTGITRYPKAVPAGFLYVDGIVGDVSDGVLRDRRVLAEEGVVVVIVGVDVSTGAIITGPEIITRGWVYAPEAEDLLDQCAEEVRGSIKEAFQNDATDIETLQRHVRRTAGRFVAANTKRRPMIVPVVMEA